MRASIRVRRGITSRNLIRPGFYEDHDRELVAIARGQISIEPARNGLRPLLTEVGVWSKKLDKDNGNGHTPQRRTHVRVRRP